MSLKPCTKTQGPESFEHWQEERNPMFINNKILVLDVRVPTSHVPVTKQDLEIHRQIWCRRAAGIQRVTAGINI